MSNISDRNPTFPASLATLEHLRFARRWAHVNPVGDFAAAFGLAVAQLRDEHKLVSRPAGALSGGQRLEALLLSKLPPVVGTLNDGPVPGGIATPYSLRCLHDEVRTKRFIGAIHAAVDELSGHERPLQIVDAGCGAAPVLAIAAALRAPTAQVTCLELNPHSARIAQRILDGCGLSARVKVLCVDAITYQPPQKFDLIISETMHSGLTEEPLVSILHNLQRYAHGHAIFVPSAVTVQAGVMPVDIYLGQDDQITVDGITLSTHQPTILGRLDYSAGVELSEIEFSFPREKIGQGIFAAVVSSTVGFRGAPGLNTNQSLITGPARVYRARESRPIPLIFQNDPAAGGEISIKYRPGEFARGEVLDSVGYARGSK